MKNGTTTSPEIPLDLAPLVSSLADGEDYSLRVEKLPARGRLSSGRNNGDQTWSLKPTELAGLTYLPPEDMNQPHTLAIRVVQIKDDAATTVALHDIPVAPGVVARNDSSSDKASFNGVPSEEVAAQTDARNDPYLSLGTSKPMDEQEEEDDEEVEEEEEGENEDEPDYAQALSDQMSAARASSANELDGLLIKKGSGEMALPTESETVARLEQSLKESQEATTAELAAATARYEKAETSLVQLAEQVEGLEKDQAALQAARKELTDLQAQHQKFEAKQNQARQDTERAHREASKAAVETALATARAEWDEALKKQLAASAEKADQQLQQARKNDQKSAARDLDKAKARAEEAEAALERVERRVESLQETETALDVAKKELAEALAQHQALRDELAHARHEGSQAATEAELKKAQATWAAELKNRLAKSAADADRQLQLAEKEWQKKAKGDLETAEASLKEFQRRIKELQEAQVALKATENEFAVLQDRNQFLEEDLATARQEVEQARKGGSHKTAEAELATARAAWETELKQRLVETAADTDRQIEEARKEWQDKSDHELEAARARAEQAEDTLSDLLHRVESLQGAETALAAARVEVSVLQAQNQASDTEMNERLAAAAKHAEQQLEQARTAWEKSAAEELAAARARYTTAEASVESLERRVEELQADLSMVSDRQRDEAAAAETDPPGKYARAAAIARMCWKTAKWIYQRAIVPACRFVWRLRPRSALVPIGLAAVAGIAVGVTYYPRYGPAVVQASKPVIARIKQETVPLWHSINTQIAEILKEDEPEIYEERVTINVGVANVREGPSTSTKTVATLPRHTDLKVIERRGGWVLVQIGGEGAQTGWIYNTLLDETESY